MAMRRGGRGVLEWLRERHGIEVLYGHPETSPFVIINKPKNVSMRSDVLNFNNFKTNCIDYVDTSVFDVDDDGSVKHTVESIFRSLSIDKIKTIYFPHRLDYKTEGILVVAFDAETCSALGKDIIRHRWIKKYRAIAHMPDFVKEPYPPNSINFDRSPSREDNDDCESLDRFTQDSLARVNEFALRDDVRHGSVRPFVSGSMFTPQGCLARNGTLRSFIIKSCSKLREPPGELIPRGIVDTSIPQDSFNSSVTTRLKLPLQHAIITVVPKELKGRLKNTSFYDSVTRSEVPNFDGKFALSQYDLVKANYNKRLALYELQIATGRTHQIRLQLTASGLPIVGDTRYGIDTLPSNLAEKHYQYINPNHFTKHTQSQTSSTATATATTSTTRQEDAGVPMYLQACSLRLPNPLKFKDFIQVDLPLSDSWQNYLQD